YRCSPSPARGCRRPCDRASLHGRPAPPARSRRRRPAPRPGSPGRAGDGASVPPPARDGFAPAAFPLVALDQDVVDAHRDRAAGGIPAVPAILGGLLAAPAAAGAGRVLDQRLHLLHRVVVHGDGDLAVLLEAVAE